MIPSANLDYRNPGVLGIVEASSNFRLLYPLFSSVGRTGRAGQKGVAYTLFSEKDKEFAGHLVRNLEGANQKVPKDLMDLAMQSQWFRKSRFKQGKGKQLEMKSKERPGLGCASGAGSSNRPQQPSLSESFAAQPVSGDMKPVNRLAVMKAAYGVSARAKSIFSRSNSTS